MIRVMSRNSNGKTQWVADFAQEPTAERFIRQSNNVYKGHLEFFREDK